jgi:hypothetical protein
LVFDGVFESGVNGGEPPVLRRYTSDVENHECPQYDLPIVDIWRWERYAFCVLNIEICL